MTEESPDLLRLESVSKTYYSGDVAVPVLHDINLHVPQNQLLVIVGPSGSGKSTLLNIIGGIDTPTSGRIYFEDQNITEFHEQELTLFRRENIGFVFQFYNLVPTLTALENVQVTTEISSDALAPEEALTWVGLDNRMTHFPAQLSGGEQQRVAIARAIAKRPKLLLCDEPTGALDLTTARSVLGTINQLNHELGMTVIIITHNSAIAKLADRTIRLGSGTIAESQINSHRADPAEITW